MPSPSTLVQARIPTADYRVLAARAKAENRSIASYLRVLIAGHVGKAAK